MMEMMVRRYGVQRTLQLRQHPGQQFPPNPEREEINIVRDCAYKYNGTVSAAIRFCESKINNWSQSQSLPLPRYVQELKQT